MIFRTTLLVATVWFGASAAQAADPAAPRPGNAPAAMADGATEPGRSMGNAADDRRATRDQGRPDDRYYATQRSDDDRDRNRTGAPDDDLATDRDNDDESDRDLRRTGAAENDHSTERSHGSGDTARDRNDARGGDPATER